MRRSFDSMRTVRSRGKVRSPPRPLRGRLGAMSMSNNFLILGNRVINLQHVAAAEREGTRGPVTIYLVSAQSNSAAPLRWTFERDEADIVWNKLTAGRA